MSSKFFRVFISGLLFLIAAANEASYTAYTTVTEVDDYSTLVVPLASQTYMPEWMATGVDITPTIDNSTAPNSQDECPGYNLVSITNSTNGFTGKLQLAGAACNSYGNDIDNLDLTVEYQSEQRLLVKIVPSHLTSDNETYYTLPTSVVPEGASATGTISNEDLVLEYGESPFWFKVMRKSNQDVLFSTEGSKIVFQDQFLEFKSPLPQDYKLFGLGELMGEWQIIPNTTRTLYNADIGDGLQSNLYGTHPFYLEERYNETANSHGVYFRNAHAHEVLMGEEDLTWRTIGGTVELYFFSGNSSQEVIRQYQEVIGLPAMQQYWTLGFHQCRWGYSNLTELQWIVEQYKDHGIPLETIWSDIDYMQNWKDFTTDLNTYSLPEFKEFLEFVHNGSQHYVPIVDAAIYIPNPSNESDTYPTYENGHAMDIFVKNPDGSEYIGAVWPGFTVFPDWTHVNTTDFWTGEFTKWFQDISFDGIWLDMNEVSSFCVGSCGSDYLALNPILTIEMNNSPGFSYPDGFSVSNASEWASLMAQSSSSVLAEAATSTSSSASSAAPSSTLVPFNGPVNGDTRKINYPPYAINNNQSPNELGGHALSPNATHYNGYLEYDWHNLFGLGETTHTYDALKATHPGKRPFIISRSTFPGSGSYAGHWGGDNTANWVFMRYSISQALSFSMFGIPMFGTDTCGFNGNTDSELCSRWSQMNAFFSFYRNHNGWAYIPQEFFRWSSVEESAKNAMAIRYKLLPYFYTLLENAHEKGDTFLRALSWEFPDSSLSAIASEFLVGPSILVIPVLEPLVETVEGVFPGEGTVWYDWYNQTAVDVPANTNVTISAPITHIPVYIRGGSILPAQKPGYTTSESRDGDWELIVAPDANGNAEGELYVDDGESEEPTASTRVTFKYSTGKLNISPCGNYTISQPLSTLTFLNVDSGSDCDSENANYAYNSTSKVMTVTLKKQVTLSDHLEIEF